MYTKQQLLQQKIPALPVSRTDAIYRADAISYLIKSKLALNGKLLIVAFYNREAVSNGFLLPAGVLYITKNEYVTLKNADGKQIWKNSRINHALDFEHRNKCVCLTVQDEKRILSFLPVNRELEPWENPDIDCHIWRYQNGILEGALKKRKEKLVQKIDTAMKAVPMLPKTFDNWIDRVPLLHSRYIYYKRLSKKKAKGFCTHCKSDFIISNEIPVHNQCSFCPSCHSKVIYKAIGRSTKVSDEVNICILQKAKNGDYLLRYFSVDRYFYYHYREPDTHCYECARLFFRPDGTITGQYKHGQSAATGRFGWYPTKDVITGINKNISWQVRFGMFLSVWNVWFKPSHLYPYNLRSMLHGLNLSYDIIRNIKGRALDVTTYLMRSMVYPFAPSLWRIGLQRLCSDLLEECYEPVTYRHAGPLHARFGVSRQFISFAREQSLGMEAMNLRAGMIKEPSHDEFLWLLENKVDGKDLAALTEYATFHKIKAYIERELKVPQRSAWDEEALAKRLVGFWKDYISMCRELGYDLSKKSVLFPKKLKHEHDKIMQLVRIKHDPSMDEKIKAVYPQLNRQYYYENKDYLIRPPKDFDDFVEEGVSLLHCVCSSGYYKKHVEGSRLIFLIRKRKKPDTPYYTMEYNTEKHSIAQCQGYRHAASTPKVKSFTIEWLKRHAIEKGDKIAA